MRDRSWRKIVWFGHKQCYFRSSGKRRHGAMEGHGFHVGVLPCTSLGPWGTEAWASFKGSTFGLSIFILRKSSINPCNGVTSWSCCLCGEHWQWGWASSGDEGDRQVHKHMPVAMLRCTWRPSQEDWRPKWMDSLKLLGLMGYLLYLQTTEAWGTQFTSMKTM